MSGMCAGKYGTVNSVREDGTLNVTFDGERLPRYCDPERCGQVAANSAGDNYLVALFEKEGATPRVWKFGDSATAGAQLSLLITGRATKPYGQEAYALITPTGKGDKYIGGERWRTFNPHGIRQSAIRAANSARAANAGFKIGDRVIIKEWAKQKTAGYGRGTIIRKVGAKFLVRPDEQSHEKYYVPTYAWNENDLLAANAKDAFGAEVKVGDTVKFATGTFRGLIGEVVKIDGARAIVRTDEHGDVTEDLKVIRVYNSRARNAVARNEYAIEKFEVGKIYRAPWDRNWLAKVLSRTESSIKVAIKSARDKTWHGADEQVTLRINPRKSEEQGAEVAKGWDWEFWADVKA